MNGLEALEEIIKYYNLDMGSDEFYAVKGAHETIEKELKDYHEIKEIAKRYHWDDLVHDTHMIDTDEKYLRLFNDAIPGIQADYRKARAFDIIKKKSVWLERLHNVEDCDHYNSLYNEKCRLTQDEFDLLKKELE